MKKLLISLLLPLPLLAQSSGLPAPSLTGVSALPNGVTATTQTAGDSTPKVATDAFVANAVSSSGVNSINSTTGAFTFTGGGVSCVTTTCTFSGGGGTQGLLSQVIQESWNSSAASNVTSFVVTFPRALQSSGATAFMLLAGDGSSAVTAPTGWTVDINQQQSTYARFMLVHKTSASDTSATWTVASASSWAVYFFEVSGTHALDQSSAAGVANTNTVTMPSITPTAGSTMFVFAAYVASASTTTQQLISSQNGLATWVPITVGSGAGTSSRTLVGLIGKNATTSSTGTPTPPALYLYGPTGAADGLFASGGIAYATFSIL